jgi:hypothetical protein
MNTVHLVLLLQVCVAFLFVAGVAGVQNVDDQGNLTTGYLFFCKIMLL